MAHSTPKFHVCNTGVHVIISTTPYTLNSYTVPESGLYEITAHASISSGSEGAKTVGILDVKIDTTTTLLVKETIYGESDDFMSLLSGCCVAYINAGSTIYQNVYTTKNEAVFILDGANRITGVQEVTIPDNYSGDTVHAYIGFISEDGVSVSNSKYVGAVQIAEPIR